MFLFHPPPPPFLTLICVTVKQCIKLHLYCLDGTLRNTQQSYVCVREQYYGVRTT
jgi:hypothetical protein